MRRGIHLATLLALALALSGSATAFAKEHGRGGQSNGKEQSGRVQARDAGRARGGVEARGRWASREPLRRVEVRRDRGARAPESWARGPERAPRGEVARGRWERPRERAPRREVAWDRSDRTRERAPRREVAWERSERTRERAHRDAYADRGVRYKDSGDRRREYYSGGRGYHHAPRYYYTGHFHRPRYAYHSGFTIGLAVGFVPAYGYRYYDPYCEIGFRSLHDYYGHCLHLGHPEAILVIELGGGLPVATCIYDGGYWVVDDCGYEGYAYWP